MIRIKTFRAIDDCNSCNKFAEGHEKVLRMYGVTKVTSANLDWIQNPYVYVILAESIDDNKALGGARIHIYHQEFPLPLEAAVTQLDNRIHNKIKVYSANKTAELCGLWNSKEVSGIGLGTLFLMRAGISLTQQLNLGSMFALCAQHTLKISTSKGFCIDTSLGNNGTFFYPKEDLLATLIIIEDPETLQHADEVERNYILDLRNNRVQVKTEATSKGPIDIHYDLIISTLVLNT